MTVVVRALDHPLAAVRLTALRDATTPGPAFRAHLDGLAQLLAAEATRSLGLTPVRVATPLTETDGAALAAVPLLVPVLRAGLGLLGAFTRLLPEAEVGMVGLRRDEATLAADWYLDRLPVEVAGRPAYLLDPMLATGGTALEVLRALADRGAHAVTLVAVLAAPEGIAALDATPLDVTVVVGAVDERLEERGFIVPGLGDAGDRLAAGD